MPLYHPNMRHSKIFLGGTTGGKDWRKAIIDAGVAHGFPADAFIDPRVEHWDAESQAREAVIKADPSVLKFYYLGVGDRTDGLFISIYSYHEAVMGLYDDHLHTSVLFDYEGLSERGAKRLRKMHDELKARFSIHHTPAIFQSMGLAKPWLLTQLAEGRAAA